MLNSVSKALYLVKFLSGRGEGQDTSRYFECGFWVHAYNTATFRIDVNMDFINTSLGRFLIEASKNDGKVNTISCYFTR